MYSEEGLVGEYDAAGTEIRTYGWKPGSLWSTDPLFMKQGAKYYYYHNDHLGTPQKITSANGAMIWSATYSSFGKATVEGSATVTNNLMFPGQYYDEETGLHYNWFRYYDPQGGRYLKTDPIGLAGGMHLYKYVLDNPVNMIDPTGLFVLGWHAGGSGGVGGVFEGSTAILVNQSGDIAEAVDFSGTVGPQVTADLSTGLFIAPFADYSDLEGESRRVNIGLGVVGVTISIPENYWNISFSIDIWPGLDFGISYGAGMTWIVGVNEDTECP